MSMGHLVQTAGLAADTEWSKTNNWLSG